MSENILVIGNGFDLAHGMHTKYEHFIDYIKTNSYISDTTLSENFRSEFTNIISSNGFIKYFLDYNRVVPGWVDFEHEILNITHQFTYFFDNYPSLIVPSNYMLSQSTSDLLIDILTEFGIATCVNGLYIVEPMYYSPKYGLNKKNILNELKKQLDALIRALEIYLLSGEAASFLFHTLLHFNNHFFICKHVCHIF